MTPERYERVRRLFIAARQVPAPDQRGYLDTACNGDRELCAQVATFLEEERRAAAFIPTPLGAPAGLACPHVPERTLPLPERIAGFHVLDLLGEGGFGVVYLAEQDIPHRRVALKVLRRAAVSAASRTRFAHEADVLAMLRHPGIAQIFEAGTESGPEGRPFFAMEHVRGVPLTTYAQDHRLSVRDRLGLMVQVCDAVQHAHQKGVVHRDLKPSNILVEEGNRDEGTGTEGEGTEGEATEGTGTRGRRGAHTSAAGPYSPSIPASSVPAPSVPSLPPQPKILDFGVARVLDSDVKATTLSTDIGQLVGTLPYMSPEQAAGDPRAVDTRSDVYALGVILYELLSGQLPVDLRGKPVHEAVRSIREDEPPRLSTLGRVFRGDLCTITHKALAKDRARRYQTASELALDLRRYMRHEPIVARPPTVAYHLRKFVRRHKPIAAGAAVALAAFAGAFVSIVVAQQRSQDDYAVARDAAGSMLAHVVQQLAPAVGTAELRRSILEKVAVDSERFVALHTNDPVVQADHARLLCALADLDLERGRVETALGYRRRALVIRERLAKLDPAGPERAGELSINIVQVGDIAKETGNLAAAEAHYRRALAIDEDLAARYPGDPRYLEPLSFSYERLGDLAIQAGDLQAADALLRHRLALGERHAALRPDDPAARFSLWTSHRMLAGLARDLGRDDESAAHTRAAFALGQRLADQFPQNRFYRISLVGTCLAAAGAELAAGRPTAHAELIARSLRTAEGLVAADPDDTAALTALVAAGASAGALAADDGDLDLALHEHTHTLENARRLVSLQPGIPEFRRVLAGAIAGLSPLLTRIGRHDEARRLTGELLAERRGIAACPGATGGDLAALASLLLAHDAGAAEARAFAERAAALTLSRDPRVLGVLARARAAAGDHAGALEATDRALALLAPGDSDGRRRLIDLRAGLETRTPSRPG